MFADKRKTQLYTSLPCQVNLATTRSKLGCSRKLIARNLKLELTSVVFRPKIDNI